MRNTRKIIIIHFLICALFFMLTPLGVSAQEVTNDDIFLVLTPTNPGPNTDITVEVKSYLINVNTYPIQWAVNGKVLKSGIGEKKISLNTGPLGTVSQLSVSVSVSAGTSLSQQLTLSPSTTDILWEAIGSYVPPFYKGKKLVASEGNVRIVGIPDSSLQGDAVYYWQQQSKAVSNASGYQKDSYEFAFNILNEKQQIGLAVSGRSNQSSGRNQTTVKINDPKLVFYPVNSAGNVDLRNGSIDILPFKEAVTLEATPYYFSTTNPKTLSYKWSMNRDPLQNTTQRLYLESGGQSGTSRIMATVDHKQKFLQTSELEITTSF